MANRGTRRRGPIEIAGQDGAVLGNQINHFDGAIHVNKWGMNHNTRKSYDEVITGDTTYNIWEDLGRPIYFEVTITCSEFFRVTLIGEKEWADQTYYDNIAASVVNLPGDELFIYDEEFTRLLVEICEDATNATVSIYASGFIPDNRGVNQYRNKIDMDIG